MKCIFNPETGKPYVYITLDEDDEFIKSGFPGSDSIDVDYIPNPNDYTKYRVDLETRTLVKDE